MTGCQIGWQTVVAGPEVPRGVACETVSLVRISKESDVLSQSFQSDVHQPNYPAPSLLLPGPAAAAEL